MREQWAQVCERESRRVRAELVARGAGDRRKKRALRLTPMVMSRPARNMTFPIDNRKRSKSRKTPRTRKSRPSPSRDVPIFVLSDIMAPTDAMPRVECGHTSSAYVRL